MHCKTSSDIVNGRGDIVAQRFVQSVAHYCFFQLALAHGVSSTIRRLLYRRWISCRPVFFKWNILYVFLLIALLPIFSSSKLLSLHRAWTQFWWTCVCFFMMIVLRFFVVGVNIIVFLVIKWFCLIPLGWFLRLCNSIYELLGNFGDPT